MAQAPPPQQAPGLLPAQAEAHSAWDELPVETATREYQTRSSCSLPQAQRRGARSFPQLRRSVRVPQSVH